MDEKKEPHKTMTDKSNGLSSTQEVIYNDEFVEADEAFKEEKSEKNKDRS
ncbi:hypothetical protein J2S78_000516 [Salibacterium salarium]|uniref:YfhE family protein n=1 Tax=Salibacterium salarium TaxID=284579 RepID=A0A428NA23_9BACI|nr:YfhE family protein [Salibacterium salarium]MDQ0298108.1 hypothetical protein [Salibacterium salarium]RSL35225.1 YfhE family protein [Salibacterium salarium]